jgi:glycosyltransferase involved in cell wall biosynthesis
MQKISACVLTYNDDHTVAWALESVKWVDEIVVVDTGSSDRTVEIAVALGARVVGPVPFTGFGELRNRARKACSHPWVLSLDADEHCTAALREEIMVLLAGEPTHDAYLVPRLNYFMGRWIRGSGWYRDYRTPQLFRKHSLTYTSSLTHEDYRLTSAGQVGRLVNPVLHFPFRDLDEIITKMNLFSSLGADKQSGRRVSMWSALGHGMWAFIRLYLLKAGFRDGWAGFVIALSNFEGTFYRYAKRYERAQAWGPPREDSAPYRKGYGSRGPSP